MNISKILDLFLKDLLVQGCTLNTINSYKTSIFVFIHYAGKIEVNDIDYELYSNYVVDLRTRKNYNTKNSYLSSVTIRTYCRDLKRFLTWCYENKYLNTDEVIKKIKVPKCKKKVFSLLSINDINRILDNSNPRNKVVVSLMLDCRFKSS